MKFNRRILRTSLVAASCISAVSMGAASIGSPAFAAPTHGRRDNPPKQQPRVNHQTPPPAPQQRVNVPGYPSISANEANAGLSLISNPQFQQISALLPALLASMSDSGDASAKPELIEEARNNLAGDDTPEYVRKAGNNVLDFLYKNDPHAGLFSKKPNEIIQQFVTPTVGKGCMRGGNSIGLALAAAGPQRTPAPGPRDGEVGFVFTSLGTGPAEFDSNNPLTVQWANLDTHKSGKAVLTPNHLINSTKGPGTFTVIVPAGHGRVVATIAGTVTTRPLKGNGGNVSCKISPTIGLIRA